MSWIKVAYSGVFRIIIFSPKEAMLQILLFCLYFEWKVMKAFCGIKVDWDIFLNLCTSGGREGPVLLEQRLHNEPDWGELQCSPSHHVPSPVQNLQGALESNHCSSCL